MERTASANSFNDGELKYKGVRKRKWGKYVSEIRLPNSRERIWLGSYDTGEKAARAFDAAQFCLRGHNANFNFPDNIPNIPGGQSLTSDEIQAVAHQYATASTSTCVETPTELEDTSSIDWSFLDALDHSNGSGSSENHNAGNISDFGLFQEPGDMYMPLHFASDHGHGHVHDDHIHDHDNNYYGENVGNAPSYLWNF